ncbi:flagellar basal body L-ring protein FlgH [Polycladidibacter stylochi]|uniref:flagellar basal body L-ring protein FlgH n=1 Tax=Polycladidibacter stylochi TaxID=1807766 RepID=UPI00082DAD13|nr:flagellar basal body L-ring protein FlgH [Pseudovibrio stylochi]
MHRKLHSFFACAFCIVLSACGTADQLSQIGKTPALTAIQDPTTMPGYRPVQMPMPMKESDHYAANSLWRSGNRAFFKDQRAKKVGDILTVIVTVSDQAAFDNTSKQGRTDKQNIGAGGAVGAAINTLALPAGMNASSLATLDSTNNYTGTGSIDRKEKLSTTVAAVVTQVLPNGNLVVEGRQEIRVNYEVRELVVGGVIRPQDIAADNTIDSKKIAEARIGYGGRGQITSVQQPRYGSQALDILLPF